MREDLAETMCMPLELFNWSVPMRRNLGLATLDHLSDIFSPTHHYFSVPILMTEIFLIQKKIARELAQQVKVLANPCNLV